MSIRSEKSTYSANNDYNRCSIRAKCVAVFVKLSRMISRPTCALLPKIGGYLSFPAWASYAHFAGGGMARSRCMRNQS